VAGTAPTIRAFVALDLDATSRQRAALIADRLKAASGAPRATWTPADRMHVTLKFAGDLPLIAVDPLCEELRSLAARHFRPQACALRVDAFPTIQRARVVTLGLDDPSGELGALAASVDEVLSRHGVPREERPFRAHVTLARVKRPFDARTWLRLGLEAEAGAGDCSVVGLTLFRSELGAAGASHTALARFAFATGTG
jgi:2'-5' RNA ligase